MRPRSRPPLNRRYFHTQPKRDKIDITVLKKRIEFLNQRRQKKRIEEEKKKHRMPIKI